MSNGLRLVEECHAKGHRHSHVPCRRDRRHCPWLVPEQVWPV